MPESHAIVGFIADSKDNIWYEIGSQGVVNITIRYAGYGQELGIIDSGGYQTVVSGIGSGQTNNINAQFDTEGDFVFVETLSGSGRGAWYSDDRNSPAVDHFLAFDVSDLLGASKAWFIAFEDLPDGGDHDYNDLVTVVANVSPSPVPEPMTLLLFGS